MQRAGQENPRVGRRLRQKRTSHRFYKKVGFIVVGERKFRVGATLHDDLILALGL